MPTGYNQITGQKKRGNRYPVSQIQLYHNDLEFNRAVL